MALIKCSDCGREVSSSADKCPNCGKPMFTGIRCPNCQSTDVSKISGMSKAGSALMWGVLAAGKLTKSYECKSCKYRW